MRLFIGGIAAITFMTACQDKSPAEVAPTSGVIESEISWLGGCWQTADGATREEWIIADATHAFAVNYTLKEDMLVFHEHARIDKREGKWTFNAYPNGIGPSSFPYEDKGDTHITFVNVLHDYPQVIKYARDGENLKATISKLGGGNPYSWDFVPCR